MTKVQEKQTNRRREIIETIIPLLEERSFDEISVEDICSAANISVGSFYHYFEKKSDILIGLFTRIDTYLEKEVYSWLNAPDEEANLKLFAKSWLAYIETTGLEHSKLIASIDTTDFTLSGDIRSSVVVLTGIMRRGQEKGTFTDSCTAEELESFFMTALRGISTDWTRRNAAFSLTGRGGRYIELLIKAVKA